MNSKIKIIFLSVVAISIALSLYLRQSHDGAMGAANEFMKQLQESEFTQAFELLSPAMKATATIEELEQFTKRNLLAGASLEDWKSLNKNAAREVLSTKVTTSESIAKPLVAVLSRSEQSWQLDAILFPQEPEAEKLKSITPNMLRMLELVSDAVQDFALSLKSGNMQHFHSKISKLWRDQATPEDLLEAFQGFFNADLDLTVLADVTPVINGIPEQDDKGVITVSGFFPTRPSKLSFEQRFIWEGLGWKLVGFTANIN
ncbi:MAG: hypothetical protein KTR18_03900 [Acidiferrobacterales bacterium]|nr:hypothetical protein [Acidiferrobacterales bacterium]